MGVSVILACAGKGERAGYNKNKLLVEYGGQTTIKKSFDAFKNSGLVDQIVVAVSKNDMEQVKTILGDYPVLVLGGNTRSESVKNALNAVNQDIVLIHDGARPFVDNRIIKDCIDGAEKYGGVVTCQPSRNTVCKGDEQFITEYLGKDLIYSIQTPQAFKTQLIKKAYALAGDKCFNDDGEVFKTFIGELHIVKGSPKNVKITFKDDLQLLGETQLQVNGVGFDCHKLVENRKLILGGIEIPHTKGLLGHSDADVLTHAIMDAILSAISERDIGYHFPDKDPKYKNANSMKLLERILDIATLKGYKVYQVSAVIMAEKPKLLNYIPLISQNLARALNIENDKVGIGATTLEGLGFVGREEGICVNASATLIKI